MKTCVKGGTPLHSAIALICSACIPLRDSKLLSRRPYSSASRALSVAIRHVAKGVVPWGSEFSPNTPKVILVLPMSSASSIGRKFPVMVLCSISIIHRADEGKL